MHSVERLLKCRNFLDTDPSHMQYFIDTNHIQSHWLFHPIHVQWTHSNLGSLCMFSNLYFDSWDHEFVLYTIWFWNAVFLLFLCWLHAELQVNCLVGSFHCIFLISVFPYIPVLFCFLIINTIYIFVGSAVYMQACIILCKLISVMIPFYLNCTWHVKYHDLCNYIWHKIL